MAVYRRASRRRSVLILLVLTSITLITLDARGNNGGVTRTVRDAARDSMAPVQSAVDDVLSPVDDWFDGGDPQRRTSSRRTACCGASSAEARGQAAESERRAAREPRAARSCSSLPYAPDLPGVTAQVIAGSPGNFESTIALDKGTDDGIVNAMPVVAGDGLVGRVVQASRKRATVLLLTDSKSGVSVRLGTTGDRGVVNGRAGSNLLRLEVEPDVNVKRHDLVAHLRTRGQRVPARTSRSGASCR